MIPLVSVIIPTFNRATTLPRAIESVLAQTFADLELIVIDDGSQDATASVLRPYAAQPNVRPVWQPHRGSAAACNHGLRLVRGEYIAIQGSDDEWLPHKLARMIEAFEKAPAPAGVVYSDMRRVLRDGSRFDFVAPDVKKARLLDEETLDFAVVGIGSNAAVFKRDCLRVVGGFDERLPRFLDLELFLRFLQRFEFVHLRESLVNWHEGPGISSDASARVTARRYLFHKYRHLFTEARYLAGQHLQLAIALQADGQNEVATRHAAESLQVCRCHPVVERLVREHFPELFRRDAVESDAALAG